MAYIGTSSQGYSDQDFECPKTPLHRPLRGYENILEDFEDEPMYDQSLKQKLVQGLAKRCRREKGKQNKPKKSIFQFLEELATES